MTVFYALLGLLEEEARHGYDLKQSYDRRFGGAKPVRFGQIYRTLAQPVRTVTKVVLAVLSGRPAESFLDAQRAKHLSALRWIDHTASRLATLAEEVRDAPGPGRA